MLDDWSTVVTLGKDWILDRLKLDPSAACLAIEALLRDKLRDMQKDGAVIGLSGGLDSAVVAYLTVRALGKGRVTLLNLPDRDSKAIHRSHAQQIAQHLGVPLQTEEITPLLELMGVYGLLPTSALPGRGIREAAARLARRLLGIDRAGDLLESRLRPKPESLMAKGNAYAMAKHRLRMVLLYHQADISNLMVVGAANRTELMTGTFSQWGCDQCADVMPIIHLYRSQLPSLAEYLRIPESIQTKPADPDFIPGIDSKEKLLGSFRETDQILWGLEHGVEQDELVRFFGNAAVERIAALKELSRPMRESPYSLLPGLKP